jgi:hypothetical protein
MRFAILTFALLVLVAPFSWAQPSPCGPHTAGLAFDPYKPSDLAIARNYGGAVLAQAPLGALFQLDPYVPIEGELLRQLGRAIPIWAYPGYAWYPPVPQRLACPPVPETAMLQPSSSDEPPLTTFSDALAALPARDAPATAAITRTASPRSQGLTIQWDGRTWVSAGAAVPFSDTEFVRFGTRGQSPIFRRAGAKDNVIYIHTTPGMVAPFRPASP